MHIAFSHTVSVVLASSSRVGVNFQKKKALTLDVAIYCYEASRLPA